MAEQAPDLDETEDQSDETTDDVALRPGPNADDPAAVEQYISAEVLALYDVFSYRHAAAILSTSYPDELREIEAALLSFRISTRDIGMPGGNESDMPKKFSRMLRPTNWVETRIQGDLLVKLHEYSEEFLENGKARKIALPEREPQQIENFIDGHTTVRLNRE
jgi:CRISPR-associated protein Csd2